MLGFGGVGIAGFNVVGSSLLPAAEFRCGHRVDYCFYVNVLHDTFRDLGGRTIVRVEAVESPVVELGFEVK